VTAPSPTAAPDPTGLLAECLQRLESEGAPGVASLLRDHPEHAALLLRRLLALAELGLLPLPEAPAG